MRAAAWISAAFRGPRTWPPRVRVFASVAVRFAAAARAVGTRFSRAIAVAQEGILEGVLQLGEADRDQALDALADPRLLLHERHREARSLAQLLPAERIAGPGSVDHRQCGEGTRVRGITFGPLQPAPREVLRRHRAHDRDGHTRTCEMAGDAEPIVTA